MKLVRVLWDDAVTGIEWDGCDALPSVRTMESVGYLVREDCRQVTLAGSVDALVSPPDFAATISIPRGCILSITELLIGN